MHSAIGFGLIVAMIAFAFGERTAGMFVSLVLLAGVALFGLVVWHTLIGAGAWQ